MDCSWNEPGAAPYRGGQQTIVRALSNYYFEEDVIRQLVSKINRVDNDGIVTITKRGLISSTGEVFDLRDMHFGNRKKPCIGAVKRYAWKEDHKEEALIYCVGKDCVAIPIVCGNITRITYKPFTEMPIDPSKRLRELKPGEPPSKFWEGEVPEKVNEIPEPSSILLVLIGLVFVFFRRKFGCTVDRK